MVNEYATIGNWKISWALIVLIILFIISLIGVRSGGQFLAHLIVFVILGFIIWWLGNNNHWTIAWVIVGIVAALIIFGLGAASGMGAYHHYLMTGEDSSKLRVFVNKILLVNE